MKLHTRREQATLVTATVDNFYCRELTHKSISVFFFWEKVNFMFLAMSTGVKPLPT